VKTYHLPGIGFISENSAILSAYVIESSEPLRGLRIGETSIVLLHNYITTTHAVVCTRVG